MSATYTGGVGSDERGQPERGVMGGGQPRTVRLPDDVRQQIFDAIHRCEATQPCPRCRQNTWVLLDYFVFLPLQDDLSALNAGGSGVSLVGITCRNCAYVAFHVASGLGVELPASE